jgi:L-fucose mutarotase
MLKGIDSRITPEILAVLAQMGHGDVLALVDRNFPAYSNNQRVLPWPGLDIPTATRLVLSLMPLDTFVEQPVERMQVVGGDGSLAQVQQEFIDVVHQVEAPEISMGTVERLEFYQRVQSAYAVIHTSEDRPYGCFLLRKGVIF